MHLPPVFSSVNDFDGITTQVEYGTCFPRGRPETNPGQAIKYFRWEAGFDPGHWHIFVLGDRHGGVGGPVLCVKK